MAQPPRECLAGTALGCCCPVPVKAQARDVFPPLLPLPAPPLALSLQYCQARGRRLTFEEWIAARTDVCQARDFIHQNPAAALAPLPLVLPLTPAPSTLPTPVPSGRWVGLVGGQEGAVWGRPCTPCAHPCCHHV